MVVPPNYTHIGINSELTAASAGVIGKFSVISGIGVGGIGVVIKIANKRIQETYSKRPGTARKGQS